MGRGGTVYHEFQACWTGRLGADDVPAGFRADGGITVLVTWLSYHWASPPSGSPTPPLNLLDMTAAQATGLGIRSAPLPRVVLPECHLAFRPRYADGTAQENGVSMDTIYATRSPRCMWPRHPIWPPSNTPPTAPTSAPTRGTLQRGFHLGRDRRLRQLELGLPVLAFLTWAWCGCSPRKPSSRFPH